MAFRSESSCSSLSRRGGHDEGNFCRRADLAENLSKLRICAHPSAVAEGGSAMLRSMMLLSSTFADFAMASPMPHLTVNTDAEIGGGQGSALAWRASRAASTSRIGWRLQAPEPVFSTLKRSCSSIALCPEQGVASTRLEGAIDR